MTERMRVALFSQPDQPLELITVDTPAPAAGELLARVRLCTLCASDLHTFSGRRSAPVPSILGHEIVGEVLTAPGAAATDANGIPLEQGDRIIWSIAASCGECEECGRGLPQKCRRLFKYGHESMLDHPLSGGLAEVCLLREGTAVLKVPEDLADEVVCPASCATATVAAALRVAGSCKDRTVVVQGTGMLGLTACAMAREHGAREVIACDLDSDRLAISTRFGSSRTVPAADEALDVVVRRHTGGRGADVALDFSGASEAIVSLSNVLGPGGRLILVGSVFPGPALALSAEAIVRRLLRIEGVHNYTPVDLQAALAFLDGAGGAYPFAELVSRRFPLDEATAAFRCALEEHPVRVAVAP